MSRDKSLLTQQMRAEKSAPRHFPRFLQSRALLLIGLALLLALGGVVSVKLLALRQRSSGTAAALTAAALTPATHTPLATRTAHVTSTAATVTPAPTTAKPRNGLYLASMYDGSMFDQTTDNLQVQP